jgi:hypothetical protein
VASSRAETQITWSSASSITLSSSAAQTSDAFTFNVEDWDGALQVSADNAGPATSGDVLSVWIAYTSGDILGDSGSDYDTTEHAIFLGTLDTFGSNTPGEDPARRTFPLPTTAPLGFKVIVSSPNAATRNIVVRARVTTHRGQ